MLSNIRFLKIISIVLGLFIVLGLCALFIGLAKSYKNLDDREKKVSFNNQIKGKDIDIFKFSQPFEAQLISSSLGPNNQLLLRYLYQGNNVLVILDYEKKQKKYIITLKKDIEKW